MVLPAPGSPAITLTERTGKPPPRMRSRAALPVERDVKVGTRGGQFASSGSPEQPAVAQLGNLLEPGDDDGARQLGEEAAYLSDQQAETALSARRRLRRLGPGGRQLEPVGEIVATHDQLGELRALHRRALHGTPHDGGRSGGAEHLRERVPDEPEQRSGGDVDVDAAVFFAFELPLWFACRFNPPVGVAPTRARPRRGASCRSVWSGASETRPPGTVARPPLWPAP